MEQLISNLPWISLRRRAELSTTAPEGPEDAHTNRSTLIVSWVCTVASMVLILMRLWGRRSRSGILFPEDKVMAWSMVPLIVRMALVHVVLLWGTNNVDLSNRLTPQDIRHRSIGSRLVLASRVFYALFIWMAKFTVSEFLKRLTASYWKTSYQVTLHFIRIFLLVSFVGVLIAILSECQPFDHYWQVVPDPGTHCRRAYAQLWTMAMADIITDILLVVFPLAIILPATSMPLHRRLRISVLFSFSAANIIITSWRVASVIQQHGSQQRRTIFASGEIIAAAAVSNVVILASFLRDRGVKRSTWQSTFNSDNNGTITSVNHSITTPNMTTVSPTTSVHQNPSRRQTLLTRLTQADDSDEDLFAGMCYRPTMSDTESNPLEEPNTAIITRPARAISRAELSRHTSTSTPHEDSDMTEHFPPDSACDTPIRPLMKTVTFSDPGGLLAMAPSLASTVAGNEDEREDQDQITSVVGRRRWQSVGSDTSTRAGTPAELQDVGDLLESRRRFSADPAFHHATKLPAP